MRSRQPATKRSSAISLSSDHLEPGSRLALQGQGAISKVRLLDESTPISTVAREISSRGMLALFNIGKRC